MHARRFSNLCRVLCLCHSISPKVGPVFKFQLRHSTAIHISTCRCGLVVQKELWACGYLLGCGWDGKDERTHIRVQNVALDDVLVYVHDAVELAVRLVHELQVFDSFCDHARETLDKLGCLLVEAFRRRHFKPSVDLSDGRLELVELVVEKGLRLYFDPVGYFLVTELAVQDFREQNGGFVGQVQLLLARREVTLPDCLVDVEDATVRSVELDEARWALIVETSSLSSIELFDELSHVVTG